MEDIEIYYLRKNRNFIILILFIALMLVLNIFAYVFYIPYPYIEHVGEVIQVSDDTTWFEYSLDDNEVYRISTTKLDDMSVGDKVTFYYHKHNPTLVRFNHHSLLYQNFILIALSVVSEVIVIIDAIYVFMFYRY